MSGKNRSPYQEAAYDGGYVCGRQSGSTSIYRGRGLTPYPIYRAAGSRSGAPISGRGGLTPYPIYRASRGRGGAFRSFLFVLTLSCVSLPLLQAQTAAEIDALLETPAVTFAQAARFVLDAANRFHSDSPGSPFALARQRGWLPDTAREDNPVTTGQLAFLIINAFGINGSFLYRLFPGPRYAFRELDYRGLLPGQRDPDLPVSGESLLRILTAAASYPDRGEAL